FVAIAVSKPQPESRALADCRRTLRLQAVVFSWVAPTIVRVSLFRWQCLFRTTVGATLVSLRTSVRRSHFFNLPASVGRSSVESYFMAARGCGRVVLQK
ncbi:MAG: hypothetical protein ABGX16_06995, partial [Pirellulales bacterium]